jgi:hypothetical protein
MRNPQITIYHSPFTIYQKKGSAQPALPSHKRNLNSTELPTRRLHVHINLLRAPASEQATSESKQYNHHDDHKDHQNRDDACAAATTTITIVTHE